jgi:hypothetical protein
MDPQQPPMGILQKLVTYKRMFGWRALIVRCTERVVGYEARTSGFASDIRRTVPLEKPYTDDVAIPAQAVLKSRFAAIAPLPVYTAPGPEKRLNLVTDSINSGSLFGGVGTALILAALMARKTGSKLRIVTRTQVAVESGFAQVLGCNDISFDDNVEFVHVGVGDDAAQLDVCDGDTFLTTSWWTTACVLGSIAPSRVKYLLQEDERMFYPYGDDWIRCNEVLSRRDIGYYINTRLLFDHLVANGLPHLQTCGQWFEPSFPESMFHSQEKSEAERERKRRLFFYARPNNARNLFYRGLEVLESAVARNIVDPERWEVVWVGKDAPHVHLAGRLTPTVVSTMGWSDYAEFIRGVDVGFCLMSTPHPSYPPFDLASSGAVVVTNRFGSKQDLSHYSRNILMSELDVDSLTHALEDGMRLAEDAPARRANYLANHIFRSWEDSFHNILSTVK